MTRAQRVEIAIMRERGLTQVTDEIRREAFRFLAMLDAAEEPLPDDFDQAYRESTHQMVERHRKGLCAYCGQPLTANCSCLRWYPRKGERPYGLECQICGTRHAQASACPIL